MVEDKGGRVAEFVKATADDERSRLRVAGEVDIASVEDLLTEARGCLDGPATLLEVDLGGVTFIDSSGLGALVQIRTAAADRGKRMELTDVPPSVSRLIDLTGLNAVFSAGVDG